MTNFSYNILQIDFNLYQTKIHFFFQGFIWLVIVLYFTYTIWKKIFFYFFHICYCICFSFYYNSKLSAQSSYYILLFYLAFFFYFLFLSRRLSQTLPSSHIIYFKLFSYFNGGFIIIALLILPFTNDDIFLRIESIIEVLQIVFLLIIGLLSYKYGYKSHPILVIGQLIMILGYMLNLLQKYQLLTLSPLYYFQIGFVIYLLLDVANIFYTIDRTIILLTKEKQTIQKNIENFSKEINTLEVEKKKQEQELFLNQSLIKEKQMSIDEKKSYLNYIDTLYEEISLKMEDLNKIFNDIFIFSNIEEDFNQDFYWLGKINNFKYIFLADIKEKNIIENKIISLAFHCYLGKIFYRNNRIESNQILEELNNFINQINKKKNEEYIVSASSIMISDNEKILSFSGFNQDVYICRDGKVYFIEGDITTTEQTTKQKKETLKIVKIKILEGDIIYLSTNNLYQQTEEDLDRERNYTDLKNLLIEICNIPIDLQKQILSEKFEELQIKENFNGKITLIGIEC